MQRPIQRDPQRDLNLPNRKWQRGQKYVLGRRTRYTTLEREDVERAEI